MKIFNLLPTALGHGGAAKPFGVKNGVFMTNVGEGRNPGTPDPLEQRSCASGERPENHFFLFICVIRKHFKCNAVFFCNVAGKGNAFWWGDFYFEGAFSA